MQEFLQTALNKTKLIICLFGILPFATFPQQTADISLELSVEPSTVSLGRQGVITFIVKNNSNSVVDLQGEPQVTMQANGNLELAEIVIDDNYLEGNCRANVNFQPLDERIILLYFFDLKENSSAICKVRFTVPERVSADFISFAYKFNTNAFITPNNTASVQINIQPRTTSVPTLNLWGLLILVLGLLLLVKYRRKMLF